MAEDTDISPEASERIRRDRDDLKAQLAEAKQALADVALRDRMYGHFRENPAVGDPYGLASYAIRDVTLKGTPEEQLPQRLDDWLAEQRRLVTSPPAEPEAPHPPASPFQGPNPGTPGYSAKVEPMVVGGERWNEWAKGKTADEKLQAMRRGDAVASEKVKRSQGTVGIGAP